MTCTMTVTERNYAFVEPFVISRGPIDDATVIEVTLCDERGVVGHGEGHGIVYAGETLETMRAELEAVRPAIEAGADRIALLDLMPPGGARLAVDAALWDLAAKRGLGDPFAANGLAPAPVTSAITLGIRAPDAFEAASRARAAAAMLKIKVGADDPFAQLEAVRRGAPAAALIVDPNQAWSVDQLRDYAPRLHALGVVLLEQPIAVGDEAGLDGYTCPIPLCADELLNDIADLDRVVGRFQVANIKLDKTGGLTAALRLADACEARGLALMVGCMGGSSLGMAPAMVLAQRCRFVDLDGPLFLREDRTPGFVYDNGLIARPHDPAIWG